MRIKNLLVTMFLVWFLTSATALARGGGHGGGGHGGWGGGGHGGGWGGGHGGGWGGWGGGHGGGGGGVRFYGVRGYPSLGFYGGAALFWPSYYYWPYFSYPAYYSSVPPVQPSLPPVYIEQDRPANPSTLESNAWSFCPATAAYYPHVKECPSGWESIAPQPLGQEPGYWYYCNDPSGYYPYVKECSALWQKIVP